MTAPGVALLFTAILVYVKKNRSYYWEEIQELIHGNHALTVVYHRELGKSLARSYGRRLGDIGLSDAWFGILESVIVARGKTKADLE